MPISAERLKAESGVPLPLARMQNVPPPPTGSVSQGVAHSSDAAGGYDSLPSGDPYAMSAQERSKYESLFPMYDSDRDGFVTGSEAVELFSKSRLPREVIVAHLVERGAGKMYSGTSKGRRFPVLPL